MISYVKSLLRLATNRQDTNGQTIQVRQSRMEYVVNFLMLSWFLVGMYLIYVAYERKYVIRKFSCSRTFYSFTFWLISVMYIVLGILFHSAWSLIVGPSTLRRPIRYVIVALLSVPIMAVIILPFILFVYFSYSAIQDRNRPEQVDFKMI